MGIRDLWTTLDPAGQQVSLAKVALSEGFVCNRNGIRALRIGIDASAWIYQVSCIFWRSGSHAQAGRSPESRTLFYRLAKLLELAIIPIFVFDGAQRPTQKRGTAVGKRDHWLTIDFKALVDAFGFFHIMAIGEAEASLAYLNTAGAIDAIMTGNSDTFVFGATHVFRNHNLKTDGDLYTVYTMDRIRSDLGLSRGGFLLVALLVGGDYDHGVKGCGIKVAHGLARCGFGDRLLTAAESLSPVQLRAFLLEWHQDLQYELKTNSTGHLPQKCRAIANSLDSTFPSSRIIDLYISPKIAWPQAQIPNVADYKVQQPDLAKIACLVAGFFVGKPLPELLTKFRKVLLPGAVTKLLSEPLSTPAPLEFLHPTFRTGSLVENAVGAISKSRGSPSNTFKEYSVKVSMRSFGMALQPGLQGVSALDISSALAQSHVNCWVPAAFLRFKLQDRVCTFEGNQWQAQDDGAPSTSLLSPPCVPGAPAQNLLEFLDVIDLSSDSEDSDIELIKSVPRQARKVFDYIEISDDKE